MLQITAVHLEKYQRRKLMTDPFISIREGQTCQLAYFLNDNDSNRFLAMLYMYD